jgi:Merozoite surface antigen 2c
MKARFEGEDWTGLEETLKEFGRLTPRDEFAQRLAKLKEDAAQAQSNLKQAILTKTATAQITDLQSMIDRYLDDELYNLYRQEFDKIKKEAQAPTKKSAVAARVAPARTPKSSTPDQTAAPKTAQASAPTAAAPAPATPARPAQAQPQPRPNPPKAKSDVPF